MESSLLKASNVDEVVASHTSFLSRSMFSLMLSNERCLRLIWAVYELACAYCVVVEVALDKAEAEHATAALSPSFVRAAMANAGGAGGASVKEMGSVLEVTLEALEVSERESEEGEEEGGSPATASHPCSRLKHESSLMRIFLMQEELKVVLDEVSMGQEGGGAASSSSNRAKPSSDNSSSLNPGGRLSGGGVGEEEGEGPMGAEEFQESNQEVERIQSLLERVQATRAKASYPRATTPVAGL